MLAALAAAGAYAISAGTVVEGAVLLGLAVFGGMVLHFQSVLPPSIILLLFVAATVNAVGYVIRLWHERTMFDEVVHAFTTFAGMTALIWAAIHHTRLLEGMSFLAVVASALAAGLLLGLVWEGFEWLIGIIGDRRDTMIDLAMDCLGAVAAGLLFHGAHTRRAQLDPGSLPDGAT